MKHKTYGRLHTLTGYTYYLLHPEPVAKDSWQNDNQQRWLVADRQSFVAFQLVTSFPTIEFFDAGDVDLVEPKEDEVRVEQLEVDDPELTPDYLDWLEAVETDKLVEIVT